MSEWPEEKYALLLKLFMEGASFGIIAKALGGGVTRSAVAGKIKRRGLCRSLEGVQGRAVLPGPGSGRPVVRRRPVARPAPVPVDAPEILGRECSLLELDKTRCRYPFGERGKGFHFCGQLPWGKSPYCAKHHRLTHVKTRVIDERAHDGQS